MSDDPNLGKLCREILTECRGLDWHLVETIPGATVSAADLYIWDNATSISASTDGYRQASRHVFLLHRDDVSKFCGNMGAVDAAILLKPVTAASLSALIGYTAAPVRGGKTSVHSLREDRDNILQCLIESNLRLQQYDQDRNNFLTRAVHDFRAPLMAAGGYCELLLSEALGAMTQPQKDVLQRMHHSNRRLSWMASAMFELGLARHEKRHPDLKPGDLQERAEQALNEIAPLAAAKNITIAVQMAPESGTIWFEAGQIDQVLAILLDNACKFAPRGGAIEISGYPFFAERRTNSHSFGNLGAESRSSASSTANSYRINIRDSGPEIPHEHMAGIFEEYTSYIGGGDRSGGGLGLAICRMIITSHEGRIWVENTERGPQFSFTLPLQSPKLDYFCDGTLK